MTILSQAQAIRDATVPNSLTPTVVGDCLVDIANALSGTNSAYFIGSLSTASTTDGSYVVVPMTEENPSFTIKTGAGIGITEHGNGYSYFSGLDATHAYAMTYSFSCTADEAALIEFAILDATLTEVPAMLSLNGNVNTTTAVPFTYTAVASQTTDVILAVARLGSVAPLDISISQVCARCVDLGAIV